MNDVDVRLERLEHRAAIQNLKAAYCFHIDCRDLAAASALFTEDGVWDGGELFGRFQGREAIEQFFVEVQRDSLAFVMHNITNAFVEIDGDTAFGRWHMLMPCTMRESGDETAVWGAGYYEDRFARVGDDWLIAEMRLTSYFWSPHAEGWASATARTAQ